MPPQPHELLDQFMEDRRLELGMTWKQVSAQSGVTVETLSALRKGRTNPANASQLTRRGIERGMKWAAGGYEEALAGRRPTPLAGDVAHPEHAPPAGASDIDPAIEDAVNRFRKLPLNKRLDAFRKLFDEVRRDLEPPTEGDGQSRTG